MIVKMIQDLGKRMGAKIEKMQEMFNKHLEELKKAIRKLLGMMHLFIIFIMVML